MGIVYYRTSYSGRLPNGREYTVLNVSMNGNYYQYAYDFTEVYKENFPGSEGAACFGKDTKV